MTDTRKPGPGDQPLVGASEAADLMDVELSTFSHLRRREEGQENSKFPRPVAVLRCGPIWKTSEIKKFAIRYVAPRPGPKPAPPTKMAIKKVAAKPPTKAVAKAASGNGGNGGEKAPAKKVAAKKVPASKRPAFKRPAKRVAKVAQPATV